MMAYRRMVVAKHSRCGIMHGKEASCEDPEGCILPLEHDGPHEFISTDGEAWQWETDVACTCEWCMRGDGDYCTIYWRKDELSGETEFLSWLAVLRAAAGVPPYVQPKSNDDAQLIDNLVRASLSGNSIAIDSARLVLRQRMNELRTRGVMTDGECKEHG